MLRNLNICYFCYLCCIILSVCLSSESLGNLKYLPLLFLVVYTIIVIITDLTGMLKAIKQTKFVACFIALMLFGILRSNIPKQTSYQLLGNFFNVLLFYLSTSHILMYLAGKNDTKRILKIIIIPFLFLAVLNLGFYAVGFKRVSIVATDNSVLMKLIGYPNFARVNFFLVDGINSYGSINGACLAIVLLTFWYKLYNRAFSIFAIAIFLLISALTDSRAAMLFLLVGVAFAIFIQKKNALKLLSLLPYLSFVAPIMFVILTPIIASSGTVDFMSRGGNDLSSGNARLTIWTHIIEDFTSNNTIQPFGFGDAGLYATHAYKPIASFFSAYKNIVINPQNSLIDIILDYGFLALIAFMAIMFSGVRKMKRVWVINPYLMTILTSILIYILLIGITEALIGTYYKNAHVLFIYIFCLMSMEPVKLIFAYEPDKGV